MPHRLHRLVMLLAALVATACASEAAPSVLHLSGTVTDRVTGEPVMNARVFVAGTDATDATDASAVTAADGSWTLAAPIGATAVTVEREGYLTMRRAASAGEPVMLRLFPTIADDDVANSLLPRNAPMDTTDLSGDLRPAARDLIAAINARTAGTAPTLRELQPHRAGIMYLEAPPATIRVWRRGLDGSTASCSGRVDVIPFEQYVKGVLPHEWIPSWNTKSLEMGAVTIRTYAWWWVAAGGKYDCADLDDTTASQVYEDETLPKTDTAVDVTAGVSIVRDGAVVFAEYSAENGDPTDYGVDEPHCTGETVFGHGRGTCQWGTQRWANAGEDYLFMAPHYYPGATVNVPGPRFDADFAAETYPTTMVSGEEAVVWLEYTNNGVMTWDIDSTRVGTTEPRDRESAFYKQDNWLSPTRPTAADHSDYGPGTTGRFSFVILAPEVTEPTTFVEHFGLVQEGETWFGPEDSLVTWTITVNPRNGSGTNPLPVEPVGGPGDMTDAPSAFGCSAAPARPRQGSHLPGMTHTAALLLLAGAIYRRGRSFALVGAALLMFAGTSLGGCASDDRVAQPTGVARVAVGGDSTLVAAFDAAARESGVPAEILATISFTETRLRMVGKPGSGDDGDHAVARQFGLMALSDPDDAARLIGVTVDQVISDPATNIRAAAAQLAAARDALGLHPVAPADWAPAIAEYGGQPLVDQVMWRLERGWRGLDDTRQRWVVVSARAVGPAYDGISQQSKFAGYPGALWNPANSGNYAAGSRGASSINYIVIHTVQGSYAGCISWFKNSASNVSAHYVVRSSDGEVTQMVDDSDVAWHDACFNSESIGIEHEGFVDDPDTWYTESMYMGSAALTAWLADQYGIPKTHDFIMGHGEAPDCSDHTDPGGGWNWAHYLDLVNSGGMPTFDADIGPQAAAPDTMTSGDEGVVYFEFVNRGNSTWGIDETRLGTQAPQDRESAFFVDGNWLSPARPTGADHSNYGPGETGRFTFAIKAPEVTEDTLYTETFQLLQEGVAWFGPTVTMTILVKPRVAPQPPATPVDPVQPGSDGTDDSPGDGTGGCNAGSGTSGTSGGMSLLACAMLIFGVTLRRRRAAR